MRVGRKVTQVSTPVADGGMSHELLAATVKLSQARLLPAVQAAVESGLLASTGDGYSLFASVRPT